MTNDTLPITDVSFKTNKSINNNETEVLEVWIFSKELQPPPELIISQNLKEEHKGTNESNTSTELTSEDKRNKMATKRITEKKNDTMVETEREHTMEQSKKEQKEQLQNRNLKHCWRPFKNALMSNMKNLIY